MTTPQTTGNSLTQFRDDMAAIGQAERADTLRHRDLLRRAADALEMAYLRNEGVDDCRALIAELRAEAGHD